MTHNFIYSPAESTSRFVEYVEYLYETPGMQFGVKSIDKYVLPMRPGEVIGITGRPGHGKSSLQSYLAMRAARQIIRRQTKDEIVLFVTWEQTIEAQEAFFQAGLAMNRGNDYEYSISDLAWGRADKRKVIEKAIQNRVWNPIWVAGRSIKDANKKIPPMFIDALFENISSLKEDHNVKPILICFDYLQRIPVAAKSREQRNLQVVEAILNTSELAKSVGCPIILGVQAKAEVDKRPVKERVPTMGDTYYTAELSHVVDKHFGIMKPIKYWDEGVQFDYNGHPIDIDDHTLVIQLDKQRLEQGKRQFVVRFDMAKMEIFDYKFIASEDY